MLIKNLSYFLYDYQTRYLFQVFLNCLTVSYQYLIEFQIANFCYWPIRSCLVHSTLIIASLAIVTAKTGHFIFANNNHRYMLVEEYTNIKPTSQIIHYFLHTSLGILIIIRKIINKA